MTDVLTKWLKITNQYNSKINEDEKPSHLLLNSGKLFVKNENMGIFYKKYSESISNNDKHYIVECRKDIFKLFFDLDFLINEDKYSTLLENTELQTINCDLFYEFIKIINNVIYDFYETDYDCIVTTADIKKVKKISKNEDNPENITCKIFIKKGFHLHFPDISTNKNTALEIRKACIRIISKNDKFNNQFENTISNIIDESVFINSGLRLTGSRKCSYISQQKEFVDEGRPYTLLTVFKNNNINIGIVDQLNNDMLLLINKTSILSTEEYILNIKNNPNLECENCDNVESSDETKDNTLMSGSWKRLEKNNYKYIAIMNFFRKYVINYKEKDIKRIFYSENENVYILCSQSKYCTNIGKNHNSEHIYFKLTKQGICQRCFCRCDTLVGRKNGYCKDYEGPKIECTTFLRDTLTFKKATTNKNKIFIINKNNNKEANLNTVVYDYLQDLQNSFTGNNNNNSYSKKKH
jgi:hypothetical protein